MTGHAEDYQEGLRAGKIEGRLYSLENSVSVLTIDIKAVAEDVRRADELSNKRTIQLGIIYGTVIAMSAIVQAAPAIGRYLASIQ